MKLDATIIAAMAAAGITSAQIAEIARLLEPRRGVGGMAKVSTEKRSEISQMGTAARWAKPKAET